jgi:hypothetical protein
MEITKVDQRQVNGGSTPWQLDHLHVALAFVNLKVSSEGIQGEPKVDNNCIKYNPDAKL